MKPPPGKLAIGSLKTTLIVEMDTFWLFIDIFVQKMRLTVH